MRSGMAEWWDGGMVEWWNCGMVGWWNGGMVELWDGGMVEWWDGGMVGWWDGRINIPGLPGCALQRRGKGGGGWICHAAGSIWSRVMSGEGWAAGKVDVKSQACRQPKLVQAANGSDGQRQAAIRRWELTQA